MEQEKRTGIARGGVSFILAAAVVFVLGVTNTPTTTGLAAALAVLGVAIAIGAQVLDNPVLAAVWLAPVVAAVVVFLHQGSSGQDLLTQAFVVGAIGVAQVFFSQVGK
ncbi:hypothetical protein [Haloarchaeobius sp. TZWWS8]|uniref:hypothetical protein n=1 Tax=Haloarchaeobius sp. TZWWS8 TaxID=3446121 RepID=UPI003EBF001F